MCGKPRSPGPRPVEQIPYEQARRLRYLFTDIDDTLTTEGLLLPESFAALWELSRAGILMVPVTGRPAGWCDHLARMWPVDAVVGENGAFIFSYDRKRRRMRREFLLDEADRTRTHRILERVRRRVLIEIPGAAVSADQPYRLADLAIDYCEDVPPLGEEAVQRICAIAAEEGAAWKVSSIHVNCWVGKYDKRAGVERYLRSRHRTTLRQAGHRAAFCGDSPNDEPLFEALPFSVGVANLRRFLSDLRHPPAYITRESGGLGFAEFAGAILRRLDIQDHA